jgi:hypothetical protein
MVTDDGVGKMMVKRLCRVSYLCPYRRNENRKRGKQFGLRSSDSSLKKDSLGKRALTSAAPSSPCQDEIIPLQAVRAVVPVPNDRSSCPEAQAVCVSLICEWPVEERLHKTNGAGAR